VRLDKAIYGCVKSALLWYDLFSSHLKEMGFVLNPYDPCIANCTIEGSQCTVSWYVDDNKISHVNPDVVTMIIDKIEEKFDKMTVTRGNEHVFLGMHIKYDKSARTANIKMSDYLQEAIEESGLDIQRVATTPARKSLFEVNEGAKLLDDNEAMSFHRVVAKLLYVSIRARMDLLLAISFLTTRVSKSTIEDRAKLKRVLEYIKGTMELTYTLGADKLGRLRTWVDASYAVHPDMKSHTGGVMSFGIGGLVCKSSKQKLNTKSSTEAEVVGASDYLPNTLWVKMFMEAQGHEIVENYFEQDNESAIKMEKNGRTSAGPRSRHIDIRYFWIKDRVKSAGVKIRHCPTLQMLGDFFTKPLQGNLFRIFRDVILGYHHVDTLVLDDTSKAEERVGNMRPKDEPTKIPGTERAREVTKVRSKIETKRGAVTWADVVRGTTSTNQEKRSNRDKIVLGSLSQNNPVSKDGV
jgi:Reverse transcriptase (RNA-dependent DNA polymerase)